MFLGVDLVDDKDDGLLRFAQQPREFLIKRRQSLLGIDKKKQEVAVVHSFFDSAANLRGQFGFAHAPDTARIPKNEWVRPARADGRDAIARYARLIVFDRDLATDQAIK